MDFTTVLKDAPIGEWIALSHGMDRIVSTSKELEEAIEAAKERGEENPVMMKMPPTGLLVL
jgi:hypothetical protein